MVPPEAQEAMDDSLGHSRMAGALAHALGLPGADRVGRMRLQRCHPFQRCDDLPATRGGSLDTCFPLLFAIYLDDLRATASPRNVPRSSQLGMTSHPSDCLGREIG